MLQPLHCAGSGLLVRGVAQAGYAFFFFSLLYFAVLLAFERDLELIFLF